MSTTSPEKPLAARDQLVEAISGRLLAGGASLGATVGISATIARWASDCDVADDALLTLAERLAPVPTQATEGNQHDTHN
jgi:hypothetical protein